MGLSLCFGMNANNEVKTNIPVEVVPRISPEMQKIVDVLADIPLLNNLTKAQLAILAEKLEHEEFTQGALLMSQGEMGDKFFIILEGVCEVLHKEGDDEILITTLGTGDYCGEQALLKEVTRNATVRAKFFTTCLTLDRIGFKKILEDNNVLFARREAKRLAVANPNLDEVELKPVKPKGTDVVLWLLNCIQDNLLFKNLSRDQNKELIAHMKLMSVEKDQRIIQQGQAGNKFYVVNQGSFLVTIDDRPVQNIGKGGCTGELALIHGAPRAATVTAQQRSEVWYIKRAVYRKVLVVFSKKQSDQNLSFLKNVALFQPLLQQEINDISKALYENCFSDGEVIFKQGEAGDKFYIVKTGEVDGVVTGDKAETFRLTRGDFFGERALLKNEPRAATMTAVRQVVCLVLSRQDFQILMGPLQDLLGRQADEYEKRASKRALINNKPVRTNTSGYPTLEELQASTIGILGAGAFGTVTLVVNQKTDESYALKAIRKAQILELGRHSNVLSEKQVMMNLDNPFLVNLLNTYKDKYRLYFLCEACLGGELFTILRKKQSFDERTAKFYSGCVIEAFDYMHSRETIYRDLKPENLVLTINGYLKVTDFGFAKVVIDTTYTLCGTPDYLAPEIVSGQGHGRGVDWWTLGILIYEMLASFPPFYDKDQLSTYRKIINGKVRFPKYISPEAKDLICRLLTLRQTKRLGVIKGGAQRIRQAFWFQNFDWEALRVQTMPVPMKPSVKSIRDMGNFEKQTAQKNEKLEFNPSIYDMSWEEDF